MGNPARRWLPPLRDSLPDDVTALVSMLDSPDASEVNVRSKDIVSVIYGFGDASGTELGAIWGPDEAD